MCRFLGLKKTNCITMVNLFSHPIQGPDRPPVIVNKRGERLCYKYSDKTSNLRLVRYSGGNGRKLCMTKAEAEKRLAAAGFGEIYKCPYTPDDHWHYSRKGKDDKDN